MKRIRSYIDKKKHNNSLRGHQNPEKLHRLQSMIQAVQHLAGMTAEKNTKLSSRSSAVTDKLHDTFVQYVMVWLVLLKHTEHADLVTLGRTVQASNTLTVFGIFLIEQRQANFSP